MSYSSMIEYLYALQKHGIKLGLETMRILLDRVGNPHRSLRVLHIGGTNGKGSTAAMVAFENPTHDFPQRIIYFKKGDKLCARIEGKMQGKEAAEEWCWSRVKQ